MHSIRVSSQLLVSVRFIAVPINTENFKCFLHLFIIQEFLITGKFLEFTRG